MLEKDAEEATKQIFNLYRGWGHRDYIGEPVSQLEHMTQCAMLAEKDGYPNEVILAALFHDIGHLIGLSGGLERMGEVGVKTHERIGADYLKNLGFPDRVCAFVKGHVDAKRYLVYKYDDYHDKLSDASKQTLIYQGGSMNEAEASEFEKEVHFEAILKMREWDDLAKVAGKKIDPVEKYEKMCKEFLMT